MLSGRWVSDCQKSSGAPESRSGAKYTRAARTRPLRVRLDAAPLGKASHPARHVRILGKESRRGGAAEEIEEPFTGGPRRVGHGLHHISAEVHVRSRRLDRAPLRRAAQLLRRVDHRRHRVEIRGEAVAREGVLHAPRAVCQHSPVASPTFAAEPLDESIDVAHRNAAVELHDRELAPIPQIEDPLGVGEAGGHVEPQAGTQIIDSAPRSPRRRRRIDAIARAQNRVARNERIGIGRAHVARASERGASARPHQMTDGSLRSRATCSRRIARAIGPGAP